MANNHKERYMTAVPAAIMLQLSIANYWKWVCACHKLIIIIILIKKTIKLSNGMPSYF